MASSFLALHVVVDFNSPRRVEENHNGIIKPEKEVDNPVTFP